MPAEAELVQVVFIVVEKQHVAFRESNVRRATCHRMTHFSNLLFAFSWLASHNTMPWMLLFLT